MYLPTYLICILIYLCTYLCKVPLTHTPYIWNLEFLSMSLFHGIHTIHEPLRAGPYIEAKRTGREREGGREGGKMGNCHTYLRY
jgi:hypothetical protein